MRYFLLTLLLSFGLFAHSQRVRPWSLEYPDSLRKGRLVGVSVGAVTVATTSLVVLHNQWYKNYPQSEFHSFNDWDQWQGVDKVGHGFTSYYCGVIGYNALRWSGVKEGKAIAYGGTWGFVYLAAIELMDAKSEQWGFSWGDFAANAIGTGLFVGQQLAWGEQRITPKFSFHTTEFPQYRPELLGSTFAEQVLKDYNGQTYWLSVSPYTFMKEESKFPKWLSFSVGYGATGMTGGSSNPTMDDNGNPIPSFDRYSSAYIALDIDLHRIHTKSKFVNGLFKALTWIKVPLPTLEFNKNGVKFHPIYF